MPAASIDHPFGDAQVTFKCGPLLLRAVRDRGQVFLDMASSAAPTQFHQLDDVEVAMGWKTVDEILAKKEPEDLTVLLRRLASNLSMLCDAFSGPRERLSRGLVERAARERGRRFTESLRTQ